MCFFLLRSVCIPFISSLIHLTMLFWEDFKVLYSLYVFTFLMCCWLGSLVYSEGTFCLLYFFCCEKAFYIPSNYISHPWHYFLCYLSSIQNIFFIYAYVLQCFPQADSAFLFLYLTLWSNTIYVTFIVTSHFIDWRLRALFE